MLFLNNKFTSRFNSVNEFSFLSKKINFLILYFLSLRENALPIEPAAPAIRIIEFLKDRESSFSCLLFRANLDFLPKIFLLIY